MNNFIIFVIVIVIWFFTLFKLFTNTFGFNVIGLTLALISLVLLWKILGTKLKKLFGKEKREKGRRVRR